MVEAEYIVHTAPPETEVYDMVTFERTEVVIGNDRLNFRITDEFDEFELEKVFSCSSGCDEVNELQTITDNRGRVYLVIDVSMLSKDRVRQIRVTPIDLDGQDF